MISYSETETYMVGHLLETICGTLKVRCYVVGGLKVKVQ